MALRNAGEIGNKINKKISNEIVGYSATEAPTRTSQHGVCSFFFYFIRYLDMQTVSTALIVKILLHSKLSESSTGEKSIM